MNMCGVVVVCGVVIMYGGGGGQTHTQTQTKPTQAMRIDEFVQGSLTTTMVDDVFFILQKCSRRALASGRVMSIAAVFSHCNILLSSVYKEALMMKLQVRLLDKGGIDRWCTACIDT